VNDEPETEGKLPIISERTDDVIGTHIVRYASAIDEIELSHVAHSRTGFAAGALMRRSGCQGKKGGFGMKNLLNL
jgi:4-hydroxy-tetrahydrodipicolinate reductase